MSQCKEKNQVVLGGEVVSDFYYSHEWYAEDFYMIDVKVERFSGICDIVPVMVSGRNKSVDRTGICKGMFVEVRGQLRSYNVLTGGKNRLLVVVYAKEVSVVQERIESLYNNQVCLDGRIERVPTFRRTPGGMEIADVMLTVDRSFKKTDCIPCIFWGNEARYVNRFNVGERCVVKGRFQSREYRKVLGDGVVERRMVYEMSVFEMESREYKKKK